MFTNCNPLLSRSIKLALLSAGAFSTMAANLSIAQAQAISPKASDGAPGELLEIVVTGSHIPTLNLDSISPVTAVTAQEIRNTGVVRIEDLINSLPQVVGDQGSGLSSGANGTATINLRGLGPQRTLTLMNGRRLQGGDPGGIQGTNPAYASAADVNQIPTALIERVDVLTGGASSTYGADAVAGVVNFVMKDNFEGVRVDANAGIYNHSNHEGWIDPLLEQRHFAPVTGSNWDGVNTDLTLIMGHNFADGAGNLEGYLGHRRTSGVTADHRDHAACQLSRGSTAAVPYFCGGSSISYPAVFNNPNISGFSQISDDGTLVPRYARYNYAAVHYLQRVDERYTAGFFGKLKFNDHAEAYSEFTFMDDQTTGDYGAAGAFIGNGKALDANTGLTDGSYSYNCGSGGYGNAGMNPYITAGEFPTLCPETAAKTPLAYTNATNAALAKPLFPYQMTAAGIGQIQIGRRSVELGPREDNYTHTSYRGVFGLRGEIVEDWTYDAYGLFSQTKSLDFHNHDTSTEHMQNALLAVPGPTGTPVCAGGQPGCIPWNIFNPAVPVTQGATNYIAAPGLFLASAQEDIAEGYVSGNLTKYGIKSPWVAQGLKVVFGVDYRRNTLNSQPDEEYQSGDLAGIGSPVPPVKGSQRVWEIYTEERMPILRDLPGAKTLDVETGYRFSSYSEGYKTNTFKVGVEWAPVSDLRLRASYNHAVRAPNLQELYQPPHVALDIGSDLCAQGTKLTLAQCELLGLTGAQYAAGGAAVSPAQQYNGEIGGDPNAKPEVGKTTDIGFVFTPSFLPNLSATLDYTDIKVTNLINSYGLNTIQQNCVLTASPVWCSLVHRDPSGTLWASQNAYTVDPVLNEGGLEYKGVDIGVAYRLDLGAFGQVRTRFDGTWLKNLIYSPGLGASLPGKTYDCAGKFGPSCAPVTPKWRHRLTADYETPIQGLSTGLTWRFFGSAQNTTLDALTPDYVPGLIAVGQQLPDGHIPSITYIDLRVSYTYNKIAVRVGVNNVLDKDPPFVDTANSGGNSAYTESNTYPSVYDNLGRYMFVNITMDF